MLSITAHVNSRLMKIITLLPKSWGFLESARIGHNYNNFLTWNIFRCSNWIISIVISEWETKITTFNTPQWFNTWCANKADKQKYNAPDNKFIFTFWKINKGR